MARNYLLNSKRKVTGKGGAISFSFYPNQFPIERNHVWLIFNFGRQRISSIQLLQQRQAKFRYDVENLFALVIKNYACDDFGQSCVDSEDTIINSGREHLTVTGLETKTA